MGFWKNIFHRPKLRERFLSFTPGEASWQVVSWNFDLQHSGSRKWSLEVHKQEQKQTIEFSSGSSSRVTFGNNDLTQTYIADVEATALMNLAIHSTIKQGLESHHEFMLMPVSGVTTLDYQQEMRALQWLQASFETLGRALDKMPNSTHLILTGAFFSGTPPKSKDKVLRVLVFNLDIFFYMREDGSLQVIVFDDKNLGHGSAESATYQQIIKVTKPQFYDEIVKLVHRIASVGEVH